MSGLHVCVCVHNIHSCLSRDVRQGVTKILSCGEDFVLKMLLQRSLYKKGQFNKTKTSPYFVFSVISLADLLCKTVILTEDKNTWNNLLVYFKWELKFCIWTPVKWTVYKKQATTCIKVYEKKSVVEACWTLKRVFWSKTIAVISKSCVKAKFRMDPCF